MALWGKIDMSHNVDVIGVYKVPIEATVWAKQGNISETNAETLKKVWLFEVQLDKLDRHFHAPDYTQSDPKLPRKEWQIAYDELFLDKEGKSRVSEEVGKAARIVFFFHYLNIDRPLITPYGKISIPIPRPFPNRLLSIVQYDVP